MIQTLRPRILLPFLCLLLNSCGQEREYASVSTSLLIPEALADELDSVTVYLIQLKQLEPSCQTLLANTQAYELASIFKSVTIPFDLDGNNQAILDGIPNRGAVWRFYARGFNSGKALIAHGCDPGQYNITVDQEANVTLTLEPYPPVK
jgi:hypothetical protein